ncbi:MAG: hypothetical protein JWP36_434 [Paucimonas sp.]|nr:hypothetical protein [Paucimonas sp.]
MGHDIHAGAADAAAAAAGRCNEEFGISIGAAGSLTGWSERTIWRRLAAKSIHRFEAGAASNRVLIAWSGLLPHLQPPATSGFLDLLFAADNGDVEAQNDLALHFLATGKPEAAAFWLQSAARSEHGDAMHWLARCHLSGEGVVQDSSLAMMWLARAASVGHVISQGMLEQVWRGFANAGFAATMKQQHQEASTGR